MAVKRRDVRESAFILSFEMLFRDDSIDEIFEAAKMIDDIVLTDDVRALVSGIMEKQNELDAMISKYSRNRAIVRIPRINVAVLRLAIYEALYDEKVPVNVAISEAVKLTEKYAQDADVSFVNGVLGAFSRELGKENA
ncbi:NusB antitermination factor [Ruminococcaceae bacterium FB2012]|nr:NusB antitermination factor [Ruminococcaceae bacterium FB2012]